MNLGGRTQQGGVGLNNKVAKDNVLAKLIFLTFISDAQWDLNHTHSHQRNGSVPKIRMTM